jgi:FkbM family methyltransferase
MDYWYSILYWRLRGVAKGSKGLSRVLENVRLDISIRKESLLRFMISHVPSGSVIFDIGANVGTYSLALAKFVEDSLVYSFEPNAQPYLKLTENIDLMNLRPRVAPMNIALSSQEGRRTLHISSAGGMSSFYREQAGSKGNEVIGAQIVDCCSVDGLIRNEICRLPDVIKIDVEGHEYDVLKGAENTIRSNAPQMFIELHDFREGPDIEKYLSRDLNYACARIGDSAIWCYNPDKPL